MAAGNTRYARLNKDQINKLQELEKEIGKVIVAFEPATPYALLSEEQLKRLREFEQELGVTLVAYRK